MSSYVEGRATVKLKVPAYSAPASSAIVDAAAAGVATAGVAAFGVVVVGAAATVALTAAPLVGMGYLLYATGKAVANEVSRAENAQREKAALAQAAHEARINSDFKTRSMLLERWEVLADRVADLPEVDDDSIKRVSDLATLVVQADSSLGDLNSLLDSELKHVEKKVAIAESRQTQSKLTSERAATKAKAAEMVSEILSSQEANKIKADISGLDISNLPCCEQEDLDSLRVRARNVIDHIIRQIISVPMSDTERSFAAAVVSQLNAAVECDDSSRMRSLLDAYGLRAAEFDRAEREFHKLYKAYRECSIFSGEVPRTPMDFSSVSEIQSWLSDFDKRLVDRQQKYTELGADEYIRMAVDSELSASGYPRGERAHSRERDDGVQFYMLNNRLKKDTVIVKTVHNSTTFHMEVNVPAGLTEEERNAVISSTYTHCAGLEKISSALRRNWFIDLPLSERSPYDRPITTCAENFPSRVSAGTSSRPAKSRITEKEMEADG